MKVVSVSSSFESGGAGIAARRLNLALKKAGVAIQEVSPPEVNCISKYRLKLEKILAKTFTNERGYWSLNLINRIEDILLLDYDILHLHWIGDGVISIKKLAEIEKPIVWTMHDMWPFTGGFHYSSDFINHDKSYLGRYILRKKMKSWKQLNLTLVSPSSWLKKKASQSQLFAERVIKHIPNSIPTTIFKPHNNKACRKELGLPLDKKIIAFGAQHAKKNKRKGYDLLLKAVSILSEKYLGGGIALVVFGSKFKKNYRLKNLDCYELGTITTEKKLTKIYSSADLLLVPSRLDNFPNTILESFSCGTPCVSFKTGGIKEIIDHKIDSFLADSTKAEGLVEGVAWILNLSKEKYSALCHNARIKAIQHFNPEKQARSYLKIYENLLQS